MVDSQHIIVSDNSVLKSLASDDDEELEAAQTVIEFLSWRNHSKKIWTIPRIYQDVSTRIAVENDELRGYFEGFFKDGGELIGQSEKNTDAREFISLLEYFAAKGNDLIFLSQDEDLRTEIDNAKIPRTVVWDIASLKSFLKAKEDFWKFIGDKYYDSSV